MVTSWRKVKPLAVRRQPGTALIPLLVVTLLFVSLALAVILTTSPWWDEGVSADVAVTFATQGHLGSSILLATGHPFIRLIPGYGAYTYWMPPLYFFPLAAIVKLAGFSLLSVRFWSLCCGLTLIFSCYAIASRLLSSDRAAVLAAVFAGTDYVLLRCAATARPDAMTAALGFGGVAVYVVLRRRNSLSLAVGIAAACEAAAVLTHPVGLVHCSGLLLFAYTLDRKRFRWRHALWGVLPFVTGIGIWGLYILQAPAIFAAQFRAHLGNRLAGFSSPLRAIMGDLSGRYVHSYIPYSSVHGSSLKLGILIVYLLSVVLAIVVPSVRRAPGIKLLLLLAATYYCELAILDRRRMPQYVIHMVLVCIPLLAGVVDALLAERLVRPGFVVVVISAFVTLQLGGIAMKVWANTYANEYVPAINYIEAHSSRDTLIDGPSQLLFRLRGQRHLVDDARLGGLSGIVPDIVVLDAMHPGPSLFMPNEPDMASHVNRVLVNCSLGATFGDLKIYLSPRRRESVPTL